MILVTGATGFLGHNLVSHLVAAGHRVRALARATSDIAFLARLGVDLAIGDVRDAESVRRATAGCRYVVHGAARFRFWGEPQSFERTNAQGTANVMEAAAAEEVERVVHVSTIAVVGAHPSGIVIDESAACHPADAYQRSKLEAEVVAQHFHQTRGLPVIVLRPGAFYGPWGHYAFNRLFFEDPLKGLRIQVHGGRRFTFPVFVPDVARAIEAALTRGRPGELYNISGESITHQTANETVSRLASIPAWRLNVPTAAMLALAGAWTALAELTGREPYYPLNLRTYVFNDWRISSQKAADELGFAATSFEAGARQTLDWYWSSGFFRRPRARGRAA